MPVGHRDLPAPLPVDRHFQWKRAGIAAVVAIALLATKRVDAQACPGDCDHDGSVAIAELLTGVDIALGNLPASACAGLDTDGDGTLSVNELVAAVQSALGGCPGPDDSVLEHHHHPSRD